MTIFTFAVLRIMWRLSNPLPKPPPGRTYEHVAAHAVHIALYVIMIMMPVTGYLGGGAGTDYFNIPQFSDTALYQYLVENKMGLSWEEFEAPMDFVHKQIGGRTVVWMLIVIHAGAALYHHFIRRDNTLVRMLPIENGRGRLDQQTLNDERS